MTNSGGPHGFGKVPEDAPVSKTTFVSGPATSLFFMPPEAEILGRDGNQLWYATDDGTGSVSNLAKFFEVGSFRFDEASE